MNLSFIIQSKAAELVRSLVRTGPGKAHSSVRVSGPAFSPAMAGLSGYKQDPKTIGMAQARSRLNQRPGTTPAVSPMVARPMNRPLRVFQVIEKNELNSRIDRMVISGTINDVCAELDRLVAKESALH